MGAPVHLPQDTINLDTTRQSGRQRIGIGDHDVQLVDSDAGGGRCDAGEFSPIRFVSPGSAPSIIVHGEADTSVPIEQGETMYAALMKAGVPASFIRIKGAEHGFAGAAPADLERAYAAQLEWFERHLGSAAK